MLKIEKNLPFPPGDKALTDAPSALATFNGGGLIDLPSVIQPPTKSYCIATTRRHITSKRSGKEG
jgi:hypothetical protein